MYEINGNQYTLEDLQQAAQDFNMGFEEYMEKMRAKGLTEVQEQTTDENFQQDGVAGADAPSEMGLGPVTAAPESTGLDLGTSLLDFSDPVEEIETLTPFRPDALSGEQKALEAQLRKFQKEEKKIQEENKTHRALGSTVWASGVIAERAEQNRLLNQHALLEGKSTIFPDYENMSTVRDGATFLPIPTFGDFDVDENDVYQQIQQLDASKKRAKSDRPSDYSNFYAIDYENDDTLSKKFRGLNIVNINTARSEREAFVTIEAQNKWNFTTESVLKAGQKFLSGVNELNLSEINFKLNNNKDLSKEEIKNLKKEAERLGEIVDGNTENLMDYETGVVTSYDNMSQKSQVVYKKAEELAKTTEIDVLQEKLTQAYAKVVGLSGDVLNVGEDAIKDNMSLLFERGGEFLYDLVVPESRYGTTLSSDIQNIRETVKTGKIPSAITKLPGNHPIATAYNAALEDYLILNRALQLNKDPLTTEASAGEAFIQGVADAFGGTSGQAVTRNRVAINRSFVSSVEQAGFNMESEEVSQALEETIGEMALGGFPELAKFVGEIYLTRKISGNAINKAGKFIKGAIKGSKIAKKSKLAANTLNIGVGALEEVAVFKASTELFEGITTAKGSARSFDPKFAASLGAGGEFVKILSQSNRVGKFISPFMQHISKSKFVTNQLNRGVGAASGASTFEFSKFMTMEARGTAQKEFDAGLITREEFLQRQQEEYVFKPKEFIAEFYKMRLLGAAQQRNPFATSGVIRDMQNDILRMQNRLVGSRKAAEYFYGKDNKKYKLYENTESKEFEGVLDDLFEQAKKKQKEILENPDTDRELKNQQLKELNDNYEILSTQAEIRIAQAEIKANRASTNRYGDKNFATDAEIYVLSRKIKNGSQLTAAESAKLANVPEGRMLLDLGIKTGTDEYRSIKGFLDRNIAINNVLNSVEYKSYNEADAQAAYNFLNKKVNLYFEIERQEALAVPSRDIAALKKEYLDYQEGGELYNNLQKSLNNTVKTLYEQGFVEAKDRAKQLGQELPLSVETPQEFQKIYNETFPKKRDDVTNKVGFFDRVNNRRVVNKQKALEQKSIGDFMHEDMHFVLKGSLKDANNRVTQRGIEVIDGIINELTPSQRRLLDQELNDRYDTSQPKELWYEENLTVLSQLIKQKKIEFSDKLGNGLSRLIPALRKSGFENLEVDASTGKDMFEMLRGFSESEAKVMPAIVKFIEDNAEKSFTEVTSKEPVDSSNARKETVNSLGDQLAKLKEQKASSTKNFEDRIKEMEAQGKTEVANRMRQALESGDFGVSKEREGKIISDIVNQYNKTIGDVVLNLRKKNPEIFNTPTYRRKEFLNEAGTDLNMSKVIEAITEQTRPELLKHISSFNKEFIELRNKFRSSLSTRGLSESEIQSRLLEKDKEGYKNEKGKLVLENNDLDAWVNSYLVRKIGTATAKKDFRKEKFEDTIEREDGTARDFEVSDNIEDAIDLGFERSTFEKPTSVIAQELTIGGKKFVDPKLEDFIETNTIEIFEGERPDVFERDFKLFFKQVSQKKAFKTVKNKLQNLNSFLEENHQTLFGSKNLPIGVLVQIERELPAESKIFTRAKEVLTTQKQINDAINRGEEFYVENEKQGPTIYERLKPTPEQVREFFNPPAMKPSKKDPTKMVRSSLKGTRKDAFVNAITFTLAKEKSPSVMRTLDMNNQQIAKAAQKLIVDPNIDFSESGKELKQVFKDNDAILKQLRNKKESIDPLMQDFAEAGLQAIENGIKNGLSSEKIIQNFYNETKNLLINDKNKLEYIQIINENLRKGKSYGNILLDLEKLSVREVRQFGLKQAENELQDIFLDSKRLVTSDKELELLDVISRRVFKEELKNKPGYLQNYKNLTSEQKEIVDMLKAPVSLFPTRVAGAKQGLKDWIKHNSRNFRTFASQKRSSDRNAFARKMFGEMYTNLNAKQQKQVRKKVPAYDYDTTNESFLMNIIRIQAKEAGFSLKDLNIKLVTITKGKKRKFITIDGKRVEGNLNEGFIKENLTFDGVVRDALIAESAQNRDYVLERVNYLKNTGQTNEAKAFLKFQFTDTNGAGRSISEIGFQMLGPNGRILKGRNEVILEHNPPIKVLTEKGYDFVDGKITLKEYEDYLKKSRRHVVSKEFNDILDKTGYKQTGEASERFGTPEAREYFKMIGEERILYPEEYSVDFSNAKDERLNKTFNDMIERSRGIASNRVLSQTEAIMEGRSKGRFDIFIRPQAEDFVGLLYKMLGKGEQGNADMAFFKRTLLDPFAKAMANISADRISLLSDYKAIVSNLKVPSEKGIKGVFKKSPLKKQVGDTGFTAEQAVRAYVWTKQGMKIPGLSEGQLKKLLLHVKENKRLITFGNQLIRINKGDGYVKPGENWLSGTIGTDILEGLNTTKRSKYLEAWQKNVDVMFSPENLNKLQAAYGKPYVDAMKNVLRRMKTGRNRVATGDTITQRFTDFIAQATGSIMFLNSRSAVLQTISSLNFINFGDNNIFAAGKAFANQKQYWKDFSKLFNSDFLKDRRAGLRINVIERDIATAARRGGIRGVTARLLQSGFTPTQIADSFAIAAGGSTFYRNRIKTYEKQTDVDGNKIYTKEQAEQKAFQDFRENAEESQQSSRPDRISAEQASGLGRHVLAFANTPAQYARIIKKSALDLKNGRGDAKTNISKIVYYTFAQNVIFNTLQQAIFATAFDDDLDVTEDKTINLANGMANSILRGMGVYPSVFAAFKDVGIKLYTESKKKRPEYQKAGVQILNIAPPAGSKYKKLVGGLANFSYTTPEAILEKGISLDNPGIRGAARVIEGTTNLPTDRTLLLMDQIQGALDQDLEYWQRAFIGAGWQDWQLGIKDKEQRQESTGGFRRRRVKRRKVKRR